MTRARGAVRGHEDGSGYERLRRDSNSILRLLLPLLLPSPALADCVPAVAAGASHVVVARADDTVWTWGDNAYSQLGVALPPGQLESAVPVEIADLRGRGVVAVAAGSVHSMALLRDGTVWAWGRNNAGQLGIGNTTEQPSPVQVTGLSGVVAIAAGGFHSLAVTGDGLAWAWGHDGRGQLGTGSAGGNVLVPTRAGRSLTGVTDVAAGRYFSLALTSSGGVWAWGDGTYGQLGNGTAGSLSATPVLTAISDVAVIGAGGYHGLAVRRDGTAWAWGDSSLGQVGDGTTTLRDVPVPVQGLPPFPLAVTGGNAHSLAVMRDGGMYAWGGGVLGWRGDGGTADALLPVRVAGIDTARTCSGGGVAVAGLLDGTVRTWGGSALGALGDGRAGYRPLPAVVGGGFLAAEIGPMSYGFLSVLPDGTAAAWGKNQHGQLGSGTTTYAASPAAVSTLAGVSRVTGAESGMAILSDGTLWSWGENRYGQLGNGAFDDGLVPGPVLNAADPSGFMTGVVDVSAGPLHALLARSDGSCWAWGENYYEAVGTASRVQIPSPERVTRTGDASGWLAGVTAVAAGYDHSLALRSDGQVYSWGANASGQHGDGTTVPSWVANLIASLSGVTKIAAGYQFSLALRSDGTVVSWGANGFGQLGNGTQASSLVPVAVTTPEPCTAIAAGGAFSMALGVSGQVLAWGSGNLGQTAQGARQNALTPAYVLDPSDPSGRLSGVVRIAAATSTAAALKADGTVWTWGQNTYGELADGTFALTATPIATRLAPPPGADADGDGVADSCDNCLGGSNPSQADADADGIGDDCDACTDSDGDGFGDPGLPMNTCPPDNCALVANASQDDADADGAGDACDACTDVDADGYGEPGYPATTCTIDNCPGLANDQADLDADGAGDACDGCTDPDGDGFAAPGFPASTCGLDNCPEVGNDQTDSDGDGLGDACDPCGLDPTNACDDVDLLRHASWTTRTLAQHALILARGRDPVLDAMRDLQQAGVAGLAPITLPGEAGSAGDGNPGVVAFYEVMHATGPLRVSKTGDAIVLAGW